MLSIVVVAAVMVSGAEPARRLDVFLAQEIAIVRRIEPTNIDEGLVVAQEIHVCVILEEEAYPVQT